MLRPDDCVRGSGSFNLELHTLTKVKPTWPSQGQVRGQRQTEAEEDRAPSLSLAQLSVELASLGEAEKVYHEYILSISKIYLKYILIIFKVYRL